MLNKNELKNLLNKYNIRPNKKLGQNFLVDKNMQEKILANCNLGKKDIVLEIGAGLGALTLDIASRVKKIFAVEKDRMLAKVLKDLTAGLGNIEVIPHDLLKIKIKEIAKKEKLKVIGNLPYYITTPIITSLIENRDIIDYMFLTMQKEVGIRIAAGPGSKDYSPISVYTQLYTKVKPLFLITKGVFYPQPEVDSALIRFDILKEPKVKVKDEKFFFKIVRTAFSKRRKTLLNALSSDRSLGCKKEEVEALLKGININPKKRPEQLSIEDFARIAASF